MIPVEQKPCNYGGFYYFFHCPDCKARMRKLYCIQGRYLCRKCADLGYYTQRLRPTERYLYKKVKIKETLENKGGFLDQKPLWMKKSTFQKLRIKYIKYDEKYCNALNKELFEWYGESGESYFPPADMIDVYVERV